MWLSRTVGGGRCTDADMENMQPPLTQFNFMERRILEVVGKTWMSCIVVGLFGLNAREGMFLIDVFRSEGSIPGTIWLTTGYV